MKLSNVICLLVLAIAFEPEIARGGVVYDNLAPGGGATTSDRSFANISRWGQQFTATSSGLFTNIKLNLYRTSGTTGAFKVELWSNSGTGTLPSASLATLKTLDWSSVVQNFTGTNTSDYLDISSFESNYMIDQGSVYWLVLVQAGNGTAARYWTTAGSGLGQTASYNANTSTWTNAGSSPDLGAQITVAVPEPGTFLLTAFGLAAGAGAVWKKRRNTLKD